MSSSETKVVFMGSPDFAVPALDALCDSGRYKPILVVSQPDKEKGRGKKVQPTPVRSRALKLGIPTRVMLRKNYAEVAAKIAALEPDVLVVTAFGIIIKEDLLGLPRLGCVNVHASLLPRYRGVSPIQAAILAGDKQTGCTTMKMDAGIDTGDMLLKASLDIRPEDNAGTLSERLSRLGAELLIKTLDGLRDGTLVGTAQDDSFSSYTKKIEKTDGELDWSFEAEKLARLVRAMTPWPSAYTFHGGKRLIVLEAEATGAPATTPAAGVGSVLALDPLTVACGRGALIIRRVKPEGRKAMPALSYLAGHALAVGEKLG